jgi:rRNA processing protein Krr1/Pno1
MFKIKQYEEARKFILELIKNKETAELYELAGEAEQELKNYKDA